MVRRLSSQANYEVTQPSSFLESATGKGFSRSILRHEDDNYHCTQHILRTRPPGRYRSKRRRPELEVRDLCGAESFFPRSYSRSQHPIQQIHSFKRSRPETVPRSGRLLLNSSAGNRKLKIETLTNWQARRRLVHKHYLHSIYHM